MAQIIPVKKNQKELSKEWDLISNLRFDQISKKFDLSHNYVLLPTIKKFIGEGSFPNAIDIGCGVGLDTIAFAKKIRKIVGIDISKKSIEIAKKRQDERIIFFCNSIEGFSKINIGVFSLAIANMVLITTPNCDSFIK